jgi:hypothetical protein
MTDKLLNTINTNTIHPTTWTPVRRTSIHTYRQTAIQKSLFCVQGGSKYVNPAQSPDQFPSWSEYYIYEKVWQKKYYSVLLNSSQAPSYG